MNREVVELYLDDIIPNRFQPREVFNETALRELSQSIKEHGVIQPIIVRKIGDKYEIIAGERRYKASAMAGLTKIPAIIRNLDDKESSKVALLENLQRKDLTPIEEARTYRKILELDSLTQEELGNTMGKSQAAIANKMRLLSLPDEIQESLLKDEISERHARSLLNLNTSEEQINMLHKIIENRMTVRELDAEVKTIKDRMNPVKKETFPSFNQEIETPKPIQIEDPIKIPDIESVEPISFDYSTKSSPIIEQKPIEITSNDTQKTDSLIPNFSQLKELKPENQNISEIKIPNEPKNEIENLFDEVKSSTLEDAVKEIRSLSENFKTKGFKIRTDEMDFENAYQIIIQIEKDN